MTISYFQHDCYLNYRLDNQYTLSKKKEKKFRIWKGVKLKLPTPVFLGFPGGLDGKESTCNAADLGSTPGLGRSPGRGHGNPLQYSCLENPHGRKSLVGFSPWGCKELAVTEHACRHMQEKANTQTDSEGTPWLFLTLLNEGCMCHRPPCV